MESKLKTQINIDDISQACAFIKEMLHAPSNYKYVTMFGTTIINFKNINREDLQKEIHKYLTLRIHDIVCNKVGVDK